MPFINDYVNQSSHIFKSLYENFTLPPFFPLSLLSFFCFCKLVFLFYFCLFLFPLVNFLFYFLFCKLPLLESSHYFLPWCFWAVNSHSTLIATLKTGAYYCASGPKFDCPFQKQPLPLTKLSVSCVFITSRGVSLCDKGGQLYWRMPSNFRSSQIYGTHYSLGDVRACTK